MVSIFYSDFSAFPNSLKLKHYQVVLDLDASHYKDVYEFPQIKALSKVMVLVGDNIRDVEGSVVS